jgi:GntR family transcriptional regulator
MNLSLNRRGGVPLRDQLVTQLEMKILDGTLAEGQRLPSVRALARRLRVHHNTVSAAYQDLESAGHVVLQKGSGVFVRRGAPTGLGDARDLDEMIRVALDAAFARGHTGEEIRAVVERWLAAAPPHRVLVVDPSGEMAKILVHELQRALSVPASSCALEDLARDPSLAAGALIVVLPYHVAAVRAIVPGALVETVNVEVAPADRKAVEALPAGSIVLFVSLSPTVLPFASVFLRTLRGDEIHVETRLLADTREWRRLVRAADLVLSDSVAAETVRKAGARRFREVPVVPAGTLARLREALRVIAPHPRRRGTG